MFLLFPIFRHFKHVHVFKTWYININIHEGLANFSGQWMSLFSKGSEEYKREFFSSVHSKLIYIKKWWGLLTVRKWGWRSGNGHLKKIRFWSPTFKTMALPDWSIFTPGKKRTLPDWSISTPGKKKNTARLIHFSHTKIFFHFQMVSNCMKISGEDRQWDQECMAHSLEEKTRTKRGVQAATIHQNTTLSCQWHQAIRIGKYDYSFPFRIWKYRVCSNVPSTLFHWSLLSHEEHFNHHCRNKQHQH